MRKYARETAFCKIFELLVSGGSDEGFDMFDESKLTDEDKSYICEVVSAAVTHRDEIESDLSGIFSGYKTERVYKADMAAILTAAAEMLYCGTPAVVAVNEAVELVKRFSTEKSVSFVNGVLAEYLRRKELV